MQQNAHDHFKKISLEHERIAQHFCNQKRELEQCEKELFQREAQNEAETRKLQHEKMMVCNAAFDFFLSFTNSYWHFYLNHNLFKVSKFTFIL